MTVADVAGVRRRLDAAFAAIGKPPAVGEKYVDWDEFSIAAVDAEHPVAEHLHVAWWVPSHDAVRAFWEAGLNAGFVDDGAPGPRRQYREDYYGAFLRGPDGLSFEAVHHGLDKPPGKLDHLWIGVADLAASRRFYETLAPWAGYRLVHEADDALRFRGADGSFTLVADGRPPTTNLHLAFPAPDHATVDGFHAALVGAGFTDHGAPGLRPQYHATYYGAYVLDPDGTNVELVNHA